MSATNLETTLRSLRTDDLPAAQALTTAFQWPHRLEDWAMMVKLGHGVVAEQDGKLVGTILYWFYGADAAALGLVGVSPGLQGQGIGRRLMRAALHELGDRRVALHATEAGAPLYQQMGFVADRRVRQHQGIAPATALASLRPAETLLPIGPGDATTVARLDRAACGVDRTALLETLLEMGSGVMLERDGEACGMAILRRFGRGHVIGPVLAPDADGARALIGHFLVGAPGQFVRVDVLEDTGLCPWLGELGLADVGPVVRMQRGIPVAEDDQVHRFALVSQAFG